jgi:hypothetical protein
MPGHFNPLRHYALDRRLGVLHIQCGHGVEEKNLYPCLVLNSNFPLSSPYSLSLY